MKKYFAELVGTFVLTFFGCATAMFLGCLEPAGVVGTAIAFGLTVVAMAYTIGGISGCHINPVVSLGCLIAKRMTVKEFFAYVGAQLLGGLLGGLSIFGIFKMANVGTGNACNYAVNYAGEGLTAGTIIAALLVEIVLTAIFVYTILNVTDENSGAGKKGGIIIGLTLTLVHLVGIPLTGTSVNPARSVATAFADLIYNGNTEALAQVWMFIVAPLVGGLLAAILFKCLHKQKKQETVEEKKETAEKKTTKKTK